ncbi:MAG: alpha/beta hydrolase [Planctomycetota bacterium]|nr:alpha/beta hydrolase [Planctomycetota bacterium]
MTHTSNRSIVLLPLLMVIIVAGCSGPTLAPTPNLYWATGKHPYDEVPEVFQTPNVEIVYATDRIREMKNNGQHHYGYHRSHSLALGVATVEMGSHGTTWADLVEASAIRERPRPVPLKLGQVQEIVRLPHSSPASIVVDDKLFAPPEYLENLKSATKEAIELLNSRLAMSPVKDVYIYVHGFNNTFEDAAYRMATLWHFLGRQGVPILYSWPAGHPGLLQGYNYDRESSEFTVFHLKQLINIIHDCPDIRRIHILGHSRGTDVVLTTLRELWIDYRARGGKDSGRLGSVIIAAPDLDWDVTQQRIGSERVIDALDCFVMYLSPDDKAIGLSSWLFGSIARLGQLGSNLLTKQDKQVLFEYEDLQFIDARVKSGFVGHAYFIDNPAVLSDVILVLKGHYKAGAEHGRPLQRESGGYWKVTDDYLVPKEKQSDN